MMGVLGGGRQEVVQSCSGKVSDIIMCITEKLIFRYIEIIKKWKAKEHHYLKMYQVKDPDVHFLLLHGTQPLCL